jgi:DNA (cytosine-5)-methyltransferase 1
MTHDEQEDTHVAPRPIRVLSLCSGAGAADLAVRLAFPGARCVCYVEIEAYACAVLAARMEDQCLDAAPVWSDLATFDGRAWRGAVDLVLAGFSCQPVSVSGRRRGSEDERWIWPHIARVIAECEPAYVVLENVPGLLSFALCRCEPPRARNGICAICGRIMGDLAKEPFGAGAMGTVLGDLAGLGYDAEWMCFAAGYDEHRPSIPHVDAPHARARLFVLAARPEALPLADAEHDRRGVGGEAHYDDRHHASGHDFDGRGERMADASGQQVRILPERDLPEQAIGQHAVAGHDGEPRYRGMGDTESAGLEVRPGERCDNGAQRAPAIRAGDALADTEDGGLGELRQPSTQNRQSHGCHTQVGDTSSARCGNAQDPGANREEQGRLAQPERRRDALVADDLPLFPPGPDDGDAWALVLERWPWLAPAVEKGAQPKIRDLADGMAGAPSPVDLHVSSDTSGADACVGSGGACDCPRHDQLRLTGNGWVVVAGVAALLTLNKRLKGESC